MRTPPGPLALLALASACASPASAPDGAEIPMDPHSHARPTEVRVTHVALDLTVDFEARSLHGTALLTLERPDPGADLVLDTAVTLDVESVQGADGTPRPFVLGEPDPVLGSAMTVPLEPGDREVTIRYHTRPDAAALQWLAPAQTHGGHRPFLFTQGQAILTRSWIPLQDTPGVRQTYEATIRTPDAPELVAVMSADEREVQEPGVTKFTMSRPIPSYLIALAVGDLARRDVSPRCAIWAEPGVVRDAAAELEDVDAMLATCEAMYGPYPWGRYDVLILPPSFPFGGMENPCLTFATPTILAGDKSLVALIAHELAHSWSGNLVTNATWNDFWLNEGFTVYVEQRIVEALFGTDRMRAETEIGIQGLVRELAELPEADQRLAIDLSGRDPDDGMTAVPYDKGAAFLRRLEEVFGRERFDAFLRSWFDEHAFRSATTEEFLAFLESRLLAKDPTRAADIDVRTWVYGTGLPDDLPRPRVDTFEVIDTQRSEWLASGSLDALDAEPWTTMAWLHFLNGIPDDTDPAQLAALDAAFGLTGTGNSEILAAWLERNVRVGYASMPADVDARLESFLLEVGRRKFLEPLYKALKRTPEGTARARAIYERARPRYHAISTRTIDEILGWKS